MIKEILGKSISEKLFGVSKREKEKEEKEKNNLLGIASLRIIAKNMLLLPRMAKEFKIISKGFGKFLENETGEKPEKESLISRLSPLLDTYKVKKVIVSDSKKRDETEKKKKTIFDRIIEGLQTAALLLFTAGIFNKDLLYSVVEQYGGVEGIIGAGLTAFSDTITNFFTSYDFGEVIVDQMSSFIEFISFGLITKGDAKKVLQSIGSFIKPVTDRIGYFLSGIGEWIGDKLRGFGRSIDKALGIETTSIKEEKKKELESDPYANAVETLKVLDEDIATLRERKTSLQKFLVNRKAYEEQKAKGTALSVAPTVPPPPTSPKYRSDKSVFTKEPIPPSGPLATPIKATPSDVPSSQPITKAAGNLDSLTKKADPNVDTSKFNNEFQRRLELMATAFKQETGKKLLITSGYRSNEKQKELWDAELAKQNGDVAKARKKVAPPMSPLGPGKGSVHMKGLGIDINSKGDAGLNDRAGPRDKSTGWLEKFGLIRNVKDEDWHVTISGAPPTPDDAIVPDEKGNAVDVASGKVVQGADVGKSSTEISMEQRQQSKPKNPTIINAGVTNNPVVIQERKTVTS
jgi:hypothetical protein